MYPPQAGMYVHCGNCMRILEFSFRNFFRMLKFTYVNGKPNADIIHSYQKSFMSQSHMNATVEYVGAATTILV